MNPLPAGLTFVEPRWLLAAFAAACVAVIVLIGALRVRAALARFFDLAPRSRWQALASLRRAMLSALLVGAALALTAVALARPAGNPQARTVERTGRDVVFVIDVSRSMLAQDARPSRLQRAKLALGDVLDALEGDRVGIIAFAGSAVIKCPLTTDYAFARMSLDNLSPQSVTRGGTNLGDALSAASALLFADASASAQPERSRTIILMTDGEDHQSQPGEIAKSIGARNVRVVTIGIGSDLAGAPVPVEGDQPGRPPGYITYRGEQVHSKMDPASLRAIAEATPGGVFLNVGVGNIELDAIYKRLIRTATPTRLGESEATMYTEYFQVPLLAALVLLALEGGTRVRWRLS